MKSLLHKTFMALSLAIIFPLSAIAAVGDTFQIDFDGNAPSYIKYKVTSVSPATCIVTAVNSSDSGARKKEYSIEIPATVSYGGMDFTVTEIGNNVGYGLTKMTSLTLPETMKKIGDSCFGGCPLLSRIDLGGVEEIGRNCFYTNYLSSGSKGLTSLDLSNVRIIGANCFYGWTNLETVTLSDDLESIGAGSFDDCPKVDLQISEESSFKIVDDILYKKNADGEIETLVQALPPFKSASFTVPATVTTISPKAFQKVTTLESINLGENVKNIPAQAFWGCTSLKSVSGGEAVESIGKLAFYNCTSLTEFHIGAKVTDIAIINDGDKSNPPSNGFAFLGCSALAEFTVDEANIIYSAIDGVLFNKDKSTLLYYVHDLPDRTEYVVPDGVSSIGGFAFAGKGLSLTSLNLGKDVTVIGDCVCNSENKTVTQLTIGPKTTQIGKSAFSGLQNLENVTVFAIVPPEFKQVNTYPSSITGNEFYYNIPKNATLTCPQNTREAYAAADVWKGFESINPTISAIGNISAEEAMGVSVSGNEIIAPKGSRIYTISGIRTKCDGLVNGIYIVFTPDGHTHKVIVRG